MTELEWVQNESAHVEPDTFLAKKPSLHGKILHYEYLPIYWIPPWFRRLSLRLMCLP